MSVGFATGTASPSIRPVGVSGGYQMQQAPTMVRPKMPSSQGPFQFSATSPINFQFSARPTALESVQEANAAPLGLPLGPGAAYAHTSMPAQTPAHAAAKGPPML